MKIDIIVEEGVEIPKYATEGSSGFDLVAKKVLKVFKGNKEVNLDEKLQKSIQEGYLFLRSGERVLLGTGIKMSIPKGYELQVRSRSGTSLKRGLVIANGVGTIDSDYRGEVGIILLNTTPFLAKIELGEALAQGVIVPVVQADFNYLDDLALDETARGEGGFGSTNK